MENSNTPDRQPIRLITLREVERTLGIGKSTIYARIRAGTFPAPVKYGSSARWVNHEVEAVALQCIAERDAKAAA